MLGKNRYFLAPLLFTLVILVSMGSIFALPKECNSNGVSSLSVTITTPENDAQIPYCTNFTVSANVTSHDTIHDLDVWIVVTGNASIINGDTDGTPDTYNYGMI